MINLRYHIVSIVAVFLALGIGLALGSTFISGAVVSRLEDDIDGLRGDADTLRAERDAARAELEQLEHEQQVFEEQALPIIGGGRLDGHRAIVFTTEGVDDGLLEPIEIGLAGSAAEYVGVLRITPELDLSDPANSAELAALLGVPDDDALLDTFIDRLAAALVPDEPADPAATLGATLGGVTSELLSSDDLTVAPPAEVPRPPLIARLIDAGFLDYDDGIVNRRVAVDDLVVYGTRYVFVSDDGAEVPDDQVLVPLLTRMGDSEEFVPGVAGGSSTELDDEDPDFIETLRADPVLVGRISTIDDLDDFSGVLATLTALDQVPFVGLYGVAPDVDSLLPAPR